MTAAYMTRCVYLVFFGEYRGGHHGETHATDVGDELVEHDLADVAARRRSRAPR